MNKKVGRNDPCPCGSGKKYKSCCFAKSVARSGKQKITAKWLNAPQAPNLIERTFGNVIASTGKEFSPSSEKPNEES